MNKMIITFIAILMAMFIAMPMSAFAQRFQYQVIYSPNCGPIKITEMVGPAVYALAPLLTRSGVVDHQRYVITLDTYQLSFHKLYLLLGEHGCYKISTTHNRY